jgi:hypothetical protein
MKKIQVKDYIHLGEYCGKARAWKTVKVEAKDRMRQGAHLEVSEKHDVMMIRWERILLENMNDIK